MRLLKWIESLYAPEKTNFKDAALEDILVALENQAVRKHWLDSLVEELRAINVGVDRSLREGRMEDLPSKADRRHAIIFCLNQILESQTAVDTERYEQTQDQERAQPRWFGRTDNPVGPVKVN